MTSHEIAKKLLDMPDVPIIINGWGSDEGLGPFKISELALSSDKDYIMPYYDYDSDKVR